MSLLVLGERVYQERRADLDTRSRTLMALFNCAKILNDSCARESPIFESTARLADRLIADPC